MFLLLECYAAATTQQELQIHVKIQHATVREFIFRAKINTYPYDCIAFQIRRNKRVCASTVD